MSVWSNPWIVVSVWSNPWTVVSVCLTHGSSCRFGLTHRASHTRSYQCLIFGNIGAPDVSKISLFHLSGCTEQASVYLNRRPDCYVGLHVSLLHFDLRNFMINCGCKKDVHNTAIHLAFHTRIHALSLTRY